MTIREIIGEAVETLREVLTGVPVIREDVGDLRTAFDTEIARRSVCAVVGWNGFTPVVQGATAPDAVPFGVVGIVVRVYEKPLANRALSGAPTATDLAVAIAHALNGSAAEGMEAPLWLKSVGRANDLGDKSGIVTCDVNFETKASLK